MAARVTRTVGQAAQLCDPTHPASTHTFSKSTFRLRNRPVTRPRGTTTVPPALLRPRPRPHPQWPASASAAASTSASASASTSASACGWTRRSARRRGCCRRWAPSARWRWPCCGGWCTSCSGARIPGASSSTWYVRKSVRNLRAVRKSRPAICGRSAIPSALTSATSAGAAARLRAPRLRLGLALPLGAALAGPRGALGRQRLAIALRGRHRLHVGRGRGRGPRPHRPPGPLEPLLGSAPACAAARRPLGLFNSCRRLALGPQGFLFARAQQLPVSSRASVRGLQSRKCGHGGCGRSQCGQSGHPAEVQAALGRHDGRHEEEVGAADDAADRRHLECFGSPAGHGRRGFDREGRPCQGLRRPSGLLDLLPARLLRARTAAQHRVPLHHEKSRAERPDQARCAAGTIARRVRRVLLAQLCLVRAPQTLPQQPQEHTRPQVGSLAFCCRAVAVSADR